MNKRNPVREHILKSLQSGMRPDGRTLEQYRNVEVTCGVSKTAEGSALVKIGDTEVIAGVKLSVEKPFPDTPDEGIIMVNAELLPLSSQRFEAGPPGIEAVELARVVDRGLRESKALDLKKLCIKKGDKVWGISVDICTMNDAGNLFDAAGLAAIAALQDAVFPSYDGTDVDYDTKTEERLPLSKTPIPITVLKIGDYFIVDALQEEMESVDARLTVTTTADGTICSLQKGGDAAVTLADIDKMITLSLEQAKFLRKKL
ncbi:MAG: exosome complex protein Rrp42 [Candidatus Woesearchaeota archaeon]|jgi:exosome complex component RRP42